MKPYNDYTPNIADTPERQEGVLSSDPMTGGKRSPKKSVANSGKSTGKTSASTSSRKKTTARKSRESGAPSFFRASAWRDFAANTTVRLTTGVFIACSAVYLAVSFVSYLTNCVVDQAKITHTSVGTSGVVGNAGGEGGARIAQFLINDTFGLGSIVLVFWLFAMSFKLFDSRLKFKSVNFTIKCMVALIAVSLIVGLATIGLNSPVNWGGLHGREVNEFIIRFVGWTGAGLLSLFVLAVFVILCLNDLVRWIVKLRRNAAKHRAEAAKRRAAEAEKKRLIAEMAEKENQDASIAGENESMESEESSINDRAVSFENTAIAEDVKPSVDVEEYEEPAEFPDSLTYGELEDTDNNPDETDGNREVTTEERVFESVAEDSDHTLESENGEPMVVHKNHISEVDADKPDAGSGEYRFPWTFPAYDLLMDRGPVVGIDPDEQLENQERIRRTLLDFGIPITKIEATVGPTVTLYEIVPENGVKISKIRGLVDDIALSLAAVGVRIIAPIPGKGTVGIEVANKKPQTVSMRTVIKSKSFRQTRYKLPIALGSTIGGDVFLADLTKMPHLLVAGATGQGKSVGLNAIITSLLYCRRPDELKFVMVDPKMVEFSLYAKIEKHYLAKLPEAEDAIITDVPTVAPTLNSLCQEMDDRYQLLKSASVRNIEEYNTKYHGKVLNPQKGHRFLPYIVIIVDEFSDLIMQSGREVEMPIARLAQKARAVGMHVIIATQRPSTNVITGIIKSNFPARIAFKVASGIDSKTILDTPGAQMLIGRGDMLVSNNSEMVRVQCAFVDTPEVEAICDFIESQPYAQGAYLLPEPQTVDDGEDFSGERSSLSDRDPLFEEVARLIVTSNTASTSSLQRRYNIGYNRAGRIMDQLERAGIVGPSHGGKPRSVLVDMVTLESILGA